MKKSLTLFIAFIALALFSGCPKDTETPEPGPVELSLYTNPSDGTLFSILMKDGRNITYFGQKDAVGLPTVIESVNVSYGAGQGDYLIKMQDNYKPSSILAPNGSEFGFEWISDNEFRVHAISPDGSVQVNVPIDLSTGGKSQKIVDNPENIRDGIETVFEIREIENVNTKVTMAGGGMSFNIVQCGATVDNAYVIMTTVPPIGSGDYITTGDGSGNYNTNVPQAGVPESDYEQECEKIGKIIDDVCEKYSYVKMFGLENNLSTIVSLISDKVAEAFPGSGEGEKITNMCNNAISALPAICEFNDETNIGDLCNLANLLYEEPAETEYKFYLSVTIPGQGTYETEDAIFDPAQPSQWDIDLGGSFSVQNLHTVPGDPSPSQGYTAYAYVYCPDADGTNAVISIVGTDGYTNSKSYDLTTSAEITLNVPGAAEGVMDMITVEAAGQQWQVSIVF